MARIFTIPFLFEQKEYEATLTVYENPEPYSISASITNPHLHQKVPQSKNAIQIDVNETIDTQKAAPLDKLKQAIFQAFKEHESQSPPVNLW